jgi:hypothetical protein
MLTAALRSDNEEIEARHRGNMIFFYEYSIVFFKAVRLLAEVPSSKTPRQKRKKKTTAGKPPQKSK